MAVVLLVNQISGVSFTRKWLILSVSPAICVFNMNLLTVISSSVGGLHRIRWTPVGLLRKFFLWMRIIEHSKLSLTPFWWLHP